jgi:deferrochelatase/peroxidase EfeB
VSCPFSGKGTGPTRRGLLAGAGGVLASAGAATLARAAPRVSQGEAELREPFFGPHQGGIATPQQTHSYFAAFDCLAKNRDKLTAMLKVWTDAAARMSAGETARELGQDVSVEGPDGGSALGLSPGRLTITFGFGAGLFAKDGSDGYGLAAKRPAALVDLPKFNGDQLEAARTGGDISVQACADDPVVAFHAIRELARLSYGATRFRWVQEGFLPQAPSDETPRNLMGFKDGTNNPRRAGTDVSADSPGSFDDVVWVGDEGPDWMRGGSYLAARRIRISLEHWDRSEIDFQKQVIGRHKYSGAPIGKTNERDSLDLDRVDADGNPLIADNAHLRLGAAATNGGGADFS